MARDGVCVPLSTMAPDCEVIEVVPAFTRMPSTEALVAVPLIVIGPLVLPIAVVPLMKSMPCWPEPMPSTTMEPVVVEKVTPAWTLIPSALPPVPLPRRLMLPLPALSVVATTEMMTPEVPKA